MTDDLQLYGHPFSSYTQKVLIALYENAIPFRFRLLSPEDKATLAEWARLWPMRQFPVLVDRGAVVAEATSIVEHLGLRYPGPIRLIPADPARALDARRLDRIFDNHVMAPIQRIVSDSLRPMVRRDPVAVTEARDALERAYGWLNAHMAGREWAAGDFGLADCAAAPSLFYADWAYPIAERHAALRAYRVRLLARPSMARAVEEARPYRSFFPLGAPDRD